MLFLTLAVKMSFYLIYSGLYAVVGSKVDKPVRLEIRYAYHPNIPCRIKRFQFTPCGIVILL